MHNTVLQYIKSIYIEACNANKSIYVAYNMIYNIIM